MNISFVIPCLNSELIIKSSFKKLTKKLKKIKNLNYELILIDDGSSDKTNKIINDLKKKNIKIITNSTNLGKSTSLIKGIKLAKFKKIVIIDCDLPYFKYLSELINHLKKHDLVYINRKSPESRLETRILNLYQICRFFIGRIVCLILNLLLLDINTGDTQAGLKGFNKPKNFKNIKFLSKKFFFDAELMILFHRSKAKMISMPLKYKIYSNSTIKLFAVKNFIYLLELFKIILFYKFNKTKKVIF